MQNLLNTAARAASSLLWDHLDFWRSAAAAAAVLAATLLLYRRAAHAVFGLLRRAAARAGALAGLLLEAGERPARELLLCCGVYAAVRCLSIGAAGAALHSGALALLRVAVIVLLAWAAARFVTPEAFALLMPGRGGEGMGRTFCLFFSRIVRLVVGAFGFVIVVGELGYDVGGLIAGLGLGGLTLALAAQDWASNLFGGLVILFDKPFAVGDWISVGTGIEGVVEDVTFRTTRVRTFDNALVAAPNAKMVSEPVVNWSRMEKRKLAFDIGLTYDSPAARVAECTRRVDAFLRGDGEIDPELISVTLSEFGPSALTVRVHCFAALTGYADYMKTRERVHFAVAEIVEELGLSFAFPSQTVYLAGESGRISAPDA